MNIDKAIKILNRDRFDNPNYHLQDFQSAIDLGIEALKLIKKCRHSPNSWFVKELPGETTDEEGG